MNTWSAIGWLVSAAAVTGGGWALSQAPTVGPIASYVTSLDGRTRGQRLNALLAAKKLDQTVIPADSVFSFNQRVGSFSRDAGFRKAPVSYNGQLITDWGGGVCQTSTTLYNAALLAGLEVVERHPHHFAPSYVPPGRDAAVAFSSVDLRLKNPYPFALQVRARAVGDLLRVEIVGPKPSTPLPTVDAVVGRSEAPRTLRITRGTGGRTRLRNSGKNGYEVAVIRRWPNHREVVSTDNYPTMTRVLEAGN